MESAGEMTLQDAISAATKNALSSATAKDLVRLMQTKLRPVTAGMRRGDYGNVYINQTLKVERDETECVVVSLVDLEK